METIIIMLLFGGAFFVIYILLKPKNLPKKYIPPSNSPHNIPDKYFDNPNDNLEDVRTDISANSSLEDDFEYSDGGEPFVAVFHIKHKEKPDGYNLRYQETELWPDITHLGYYVFDKQDHLVKEVMLDFEQDGRTRAEGKYEGFLKDMRKVKFLVTHNMDFKERALKADFLKNGHKLTLFRRDKVCLMENGAEIVGIETTYGDYKWPKLEELITRIFYPMEDVEFYEPEGMDDFQWETRAMAKCYIEMN